MGINFARDDKSHRGARPAEVERDSQRLERFGTGTGHDNERRLRSDQKKMPAVAIPVLKEDNGRVA